MTSPLLLMWSCSAGCWTALAYEPNVDEGFIVGVKVYFLGAIALQLHFDAGLAVAPGEQQFHTLLADARATVQAGGFN